MGCDIAVSDLSGDGGIYAADERNSSALGVMTDDGEGGNLLGVAGASEKPINVNSTLGLSQSKDWRDGVAETGGVSP